MKNYNDKPIVGNFYWVMGDEYPYEVLVIRKINKGYPEDVYEGEDKNGYTETYHPDQLYETVEDMLEVFRDNAEHRPHNRYVKGTLVYFIAQDRVCQSPIISVCECANNEFTYCVYVYVGNVSSTLMFKEKDLFRSFQDLMDYHADNIVSEKCPLPSN